MQPLGQKLQQTRLAKKITLEEAARVTKIRAARIQEIEAEDFSSFSSLAYAKGFLLIYGKYLGVDVTPYLDAFETSDSVSVDGYSYLQDAPGGAITPIIRRRPVKRPALLPLIISVGVLVLGLYLIKLMLNIQRITPSRTAGPETVAVASATPQPSLSPSPSAPEIAAPRALPVEESPTPGEAVETVAPTPAPTAVVAAPTEPEVRRAEPVHPEDFGQPIVIPSPGDRVDIKAARKTYVRVMVDNATQPAFAGWIDPSDPPLSFVGHRITIKVLERGAVQVTKNGAALVSGDPDVRFE